MRDIGPTHSQRGRIRICCRVGINGGYAPTYSVALVLERGVFPVLRQRKRHGYGVVVVVVVVVDASFCIFGRRRIVSIFHPVGILRGAVGIS